MKTTLLLAAGTLAQLVLSTPLELSHQLLPRDDDSCGPNLQTCNPSSANSKTLPALGPDFSSLYLSLLDSVKGINFKRSTTTTTTQSRRDDTPSFCCAASTSCLTLTLSSSTTIPFCYDKFTTNYIFPDGSSGTLATGLFTTPDGTATANLLTGDFRNSSSSSSVSAAAAAAPATSSAAISGNIYAADPDAKPNTATLSIPPQYTAEGVGSAIPLTELGTVVASATATAAGTASASGSSAAVATSAAAGTAVASASASGSAASASQTGGAAAMGAGWVPGAAVVVGAGWAWAWVVAL